MQRVPCRSPPWLFFYKLELPGLFDEPQIQYPDTPFCAGASSPQDPIKMKMPGTRPGIFISLSCG
jgi:hypothetical protein